MEVKETFCQKKSLDGLLDFMKIYSVIYLLLR